MFRWSIQRPEMKKARFTTGPLHQKASSSFIFLRNHPYRVIFFSSWFSPFLSCLSSSTWPPFLEPKDYSPDGFPCCLVSLKPLSFPSTALFPLPPCSGLEACFLE